MQMLSPGGWLRLRSPGQYESIALYLHYLLSIPRGSRGLVYLEIIARKSVGANVFQTCLTKSSAMQQVSDLSYPEDALLTLSGCEGNVNMSSRIWCALVAAGAAELPARVLKGRYYVLFEFSTISDHNC